MAKPPSCERWLQAGARHKVEKPDLVDTNKATFVGGEGQKTAADRVQVTMAMLRSCAHTPSANHSSDISIDTRVQMGSKAAARESDTELQSQTKLKRRI